MMPLGGQQVQEGTQGEYRQAPPGGQANMTSEEQPLDSTVGMLDVVKEMRAVKGQLAPRPSLAEIQSADKAISEIEHRLLRKLAEIVEVNKRPYGVNADWFQALQAMREDRCRRDAEIELRPLKAVLELEQFHRHYDAIIAAAEKAIVGGTSDIAAPAVPFGLVSNLKVGAGPRMIEYDTGGVMRADASQSEGPSAALAPGVSMPSAAPARMRSGVPASDLDTIPETTHNGIPASLIAMIEDAAMDKRTTFDISSNFHKNVKAIPESFGHLTDLTHVNLSGNRLYFLPTSIGNLVNLVQLDVYGNDLVDLPETIGNLENLRILNFHGNKIEELPTSIGGCVSLVEIQGDFNKLKALPEAIGQCENLEKMSFALNQLRLLPRSLGSLQKLVDIDLHYNQLEALPDGICRLTNLKILNIAAQHFSLKELPANIGNLTNLMELNVSECHLSVLPSSMTQMTSLTKLKLDGNPLVDPPREVIPLGIEAIMEHIQQRPPASSGSGVQSSKSRSGGFAPKEIEFPSGLKKFFGLGSRQSGDGPGGIVSRKKASPGRQSSVPAGFSTV
eukprot:TRINITY_DN9668_c0_g1_i1.p1 TRINITY_DN9668_c0_g1~~TRINITY_DN9668_c0_g1_i1.p1  ORF type:complete len:561 (-),score=90.27 TRINITY_DN9668_c0_g1_i1:1299-2981(-)